MNTLAATLGWGTVALTITIALLGAPPAALAVLTAGAVGCCIVGSIQAREARARAQVDRIIERSRAR